MTGGMFDLLTEAAAVQEFVGCDFGTALEIVKAANEVEPDESTAPVTIDNVVYGVDFRRR